eukprot:jgi/Astpho2/3175/e_gw1.00052.17.1_t
MPKTNKIRTHFLKNCDLPSLLEPAPAHEATWTATKVIVTLGPSCHEVDTLCQLLQSGATCARIDLTWGTLDFHKRSLRNLNDAMRKTRKLCAVMLDTVGREITVKREVQIDEMGWPVHDGAMSVGAGQKIILTTREGAEATSEVLPVSYPKFHSMVERGDTIFLGRYLVTGSEESSLFLHVDDVAGNDVVCTARNNASLDGLLTIFHTERSSDTLQNVQNDLQILSQEDKDALSQLANEFEIDFVSLSFTRSREDVTAARDYLDSLGMVHTKVLAKLETRQSLFAFRHITQEADGIIMSRGNLGLDVLAEKMALVQKALVQTCNIMGKPCIITRVVDTMVTAPRPTRQAMAEATDIANAVLDGVDGILLGAETLRGRHPVAVVETILHICKQAEKVFDHSHHFEFLMQASDCHCVPYMSKLESIASSAVRAADKVMASLIIVYTHSGQTAQLVSKYRPAMPILTLVIPQLKSDGHKWTLEGRATARQCQISRGLLPVLAAPSPSGETLLEEAVLMSAKVGLVRANDHIVCVQRIHEAYVVKIVSVNDKGTGIEDIRPKSLIDMMKVRLEETMQTGQATCVRDKKGQVATFVQDRVARIRWWSTSSVEGCSLVGWAGPCCAGAGPSSAEVPANCLTGSQKCLGAQAGRRAWSSPDSIY